MNRHDALERELTAWFSDTAMPRTPDYTTDIVQLTATVRQRPGWAFPERWLPMSVITLGRRTFAPFPWRTVGLLAVLALLLAAAVAFYVGNRSRLPAPYGLAANGLVAYAKDGDILTVDPATGAHQAVTSGPEEDQEPRWSLDGTRIAFLRGSLDIDSKARLVIVDRQANVIAQTVVVEGVDSDSVAWSPDGRSITLAGGAVNQRRTLYLVDAADGSVTPLAAAYEGLDVHWRPTDGRQLLVLGRTAEGVALLMVDVNDPTAVQTVARAGAGETLRPAGWTPDGRRVLYSRSPADSNGEAIERETRTHVLDLTMGSEVVIDAGFPHVSNDGMRIVALDEAGLPCVASIEGGACIQIGSQAYAGSHAAGASWAPNDEFVMVRLANSSRTILLDPAGGTNLQPTWIEDGAESWQRLAP
jgi:Tol biopolymer transport system component